MSRFEKLLKRFLSKPKNFKYEELRSLLNGIGYEELKTGRASGSRAAFINRKTQHVIRLHKPHPQNILKRYQLEYLEEELRNIGAI